MLKKLKIFQFLLILIINIQNINAQNIAFSQYNYTPFYANPGIAGSKSEAALMLDYRRQQYVADLKMETFNFSGIYPFIKKQSQKRWGGIGISAIHDQTNTFGNFQLQAISAALAYNFTIHNFHSISLGIQGGYFHQRVNEREGFTTGSQYDPILGYSPDAPLGENLQSKRVGYFNSSAGIYWRQIDENLREVTYVGFSTFQLNQPNVAFVGDNNQLPVKYVLMAGRKVFKSKRFEIFPEFLFIHQSNLNFFNFGARFSYIFEYNNPYSFLKNGSLDFRARYMTNDLLSFSLQFNQPHFGFGFSYDVPVASNERTPYKNAVEFTIVLRKPMRKKQKPIIIDDRYSIGQIRENLNTTTLLEPVPQPIDTIVDIDIPKNFVLSIQKDFHFEFNKTEINDSSQVFLDELATWMKEDPKLNLEIIGHADAIGRESDNMKISRLRSKTVAEYLISKGIDKNRIRTLGKGSKDPVAPNDTEENRAKNRRVEFIITSY